MQLSSFYEARILDDQSAVNITIFRYFLPKAECIEGLGLVPTIPAELPEETHTKALRDLTEDEDTQLQEALKYFAKGEKQSDDPSEIEPENPIGASDGDDEADGSVSAAPSASEAKDLSELFAQYAGGQLGYLYNHLSQFFWI